MTVSSHERQTENCAGILRAGAGLPRALLPSGGSTCTGPTPGGTTGTSTPMSCQYQYLPVMQVPDILPQLPLHAALQDEVLQMITLHVTRGGVEVLSLCIFVPF